MNFNTQLNITFPSEKDKWNVAGLWQDSFNDSPEYIEFFFNRVYKPENTLVIKLNGFIVSALQMIPYKAKLGDQFLPVAYICGACTHPFERGKGFMKMLMHHAMFEMKRRGFSFATVIPAEPSLFDFYQQFGFTDAIYQSIENLNYNKFLVNTLESYYNLTFEECTPKHFQYFDRKQHERFRTIIHDAYDFELILHELNCTGGRSYAALNNNTPAGIAFAEKISKDTILVKDIFADTERVFTALYRYAFRLFDAQYVKIYSPLHPDKKKFKYGLGCNLDKKNRRFYTFNMSLMHD